MYLGIGEAYLPVVQIGLQTLCVIAAGRLAASRGLFDAAPVCRTLNRFVVVVCLPALQFWLLAIKTDMRNMEHWRAVGAFMLWTLLVQIGCTAWVLTFEGGKLSRICVHSLVLAANNTGILAPVVLEAVVGPSAAAVGMLATIVLYFQQLPVAMVLFELDKMAEQTRSTNSNNTNVSTGSGGGSGGGVKEYAIPLLQATMFEEAAPTSTPSTSASFVKWNGDEFGDAVDGAGGWRMGAGRGDLRGCGLGSDGNGNGSGSDPWVRSTSSKESVWDSSAWDLPQPAGSGQQLPSQLQVLSYTAPSAATAVVATAATAVAASTGSTAASPSFPPGERKEASCSTSGVVVSAENLLCSFRNHPHPHRQQQLQLQQSHCHGYGHQLSGEVVNVGTVGGRSPLEMAKIGRKVGASHGDGGGGTEVPAARSGWGAAGGGVLGEVDTSLGSEANGSLRAWTAWGGRGNSTSAAASCGGDGGGDRGGDRGGATAAAAAATIQGSVENGDYGNDYGKERAAAPFAPTGMSVAPGSMVDSAGGGGCTANRAGVAVEANGRCGFWLTSIRRPDDPDLHHFHVGHPPLRDSQQQQPSKLDHEKHHPHPHHRHAAIPRPSCQRPRQFLPYSIVADDNAAVSADVCSPLSGLPRAIASASAAATTGRNVRSETSSSSSLPSASSEEPSMRHAAQLVLGNALMWTTGAATGVSMLGLHAVLDPDVPSHVRELRFVDGTLSWLARCSVPVSLFAMGLFTSSRPGCGVSDARSVRTLVSYLLVKLLVLPWVMVFVNSLLGLDGRLAQALLVLTCVPVGQNAFLVTEQFGEGAEAVTAVMQAGLLLMLPHVAGVMAGLRWMGLYQGTTA